MIRVRNRSVLLIAALGALGGCASTPPEADPVVQKLSDLDSRLLRIERVLANQSLLDLSQRIEASQNEVRILRGQLEELQHNATRTQDQQRDMYGDLDRRLASVEGGAAAGAALGAAPTSSLPVPQGDDRANYQAAFDLLKDGKYTEAAAAFKEFLVKFPGSGLSDNAQYWLGEAHYVTKQYPDALRAFRTVLEKYPDSRKTPDALLKIGYCNYELKNWGEARTALDQVVKQYADTTAARLASQRLAKMESEGR
ncbi:tol-pal system protein YbgF [Povalibacter uvarum]|uniref:Cell division coordinator CpoB n=1 Tax=Povalibacter uvarum TaxID=732238 RepID=A0A841HH12_9GAMM|nr:tol-pal system protein YbgF [Povalibacter uvarum]MBB6092217.1 tol-pal system protein YbgF [Povalibacter uvarum]